MNRLARGAFSTIVALLVGLAVSAGLALIAGANPAAAFAALLEGAFGSVDGWSEVAVKSCPLVLCGVGVAVAFQAGIWNVGAEGQLLFGALAAAWLGPAMADLPGAVALPLVLAGAAVAGGAWAAVAGALKVFRGVNEVIGTIMLNFVATYVVSYLVHGPLMAPGGQYPQTQALPPSVRLVRLVPPSRLHGGVFVALAIAVAMAMLLRRTVYGFEIRAVGANPRAAYIAGISVRSRGLLAIMLSGALAGLAGGIEVCAVTYRLYERFSPGYGFTAIAVALLGRLDPLGVLVAGCFFGALEAGSNAMQRNAGVSSVLVSVIQAAIILCLVAFERREWFQLDDQ